MKKRILKVDTKIPTFSVFLPFLEKMQEEGEVEMYFPTSPSSFLFVTVKTNKEIKYKNKYIKEVSSLPHWVERINFWVCRYREENK